MNNLKFSVIIPCYNSEAFIERAINSIICQTYKNWELIVVNDGSTDNTENVVKSIINHNKGYNIVLKTIPNSGPSTARNTGLSVATGDYVCFLDSDDEYVNTLFEKINNINQDFDVCFFGWSDVYESGKIIDNTNNYNFPKNAISGIESIKQKCKRKIWMCNCSEVYKREILLDNNIKYPEGVFSGEDACFIYTSLLHSKIVVSIKDPLFLCHFRSNSLMHSSFSSRLLTEFKAVDILLASVNKCNHINHTDKKELTELFKTLKECVHISIAHKIALDSLNYKNFKIKKNNNLSKIKIHLPKIKKYMPRNTYIQALLYKCSTRLFYKICKIRYKRNIK